VVGIGAEGIAGLAPAARAAVEAAEVILGGARHLEMVAHLGTEKLAWPSPFDALIGEIMARRGRRVAVLATGDPLWFSVGARIGRRIDPREIVYHPHVGAFQLAAARLGWSLADVETLSVHGRPVEQVIPFIQPGVRLLVLTTGAETPGQIAGFLNERGYGQSPMSVLANMGAADEARFDGVAKDWGYDVPEFNTLAVECVAGPGALVTARAPGLADELFAHDGNMTKREIRAVTLAALMPMRGALLWDIGCGCGSVAVEWMRACQDARAIGVEPRADRRALAAANAMRLGAPLLELIDGSAPEALAGLPAPDAVFIGGGLTREVFAAAWAALKPLGRLVVNSVTLESEALLTQLQAAYGGELVRLLVERTEAIGGRRGWKPQRAVTVWSVEKR
jgi:precorrin-6Y C5,15-methyltransferase (decarboxylating)